MYTIGLGLGSELVFNGYPHQSGSISHPELGQQAPAMRFNGLQADKERISNLLGGMLLDDEVQDIFFAP